MEMPRTQIKRKKLLKKEAILNPNLNSKRDQSLNSLN